MALEGFDSEFALIDVALVIAVCELSCDFSQIVLSDGLATKMTRTVRLRSGSPAIHQEKHHLGSPNHNENSERRWASTAPRRSSNESRLYQPACLRSSVRLLSTSYPSAIFSIRAFASASFNDLAVTRMLSAHFAPMLGISHKEACCQHRTLLMAKPSWRHNRPSETVPLFSRIHSQRRAQSARPILSARSAFR